MVKPGTVNVLEYRELQNKGDVWRALATYLTNLHMLQTGGVLSDFHNAKHLSKNTAMQQKSYLGLPRAGLGFAAGVLLWGHLPSFAFTSRKEKLSLAGALPLACRPLLTAPVLSTAEAPPCVCFSLLLGLTGGVGAASAAGAATPAGLSFLGFLLLAAMLSSCPVLGGSSRGRLL